MQLDSSPIYIHLHYKKKLKFSMGRSIETKYWDPERHKPKRGYKYYSAYNTLLNTINQVVDDYNSSKIVSNEFDLQEAKTLILKAINKEDRSTELNIYDHYKLWLEDKQKKGENRQSTAIKRGTTIKQFESFCLYNKKSYSAKQINNNIMQDFKDYLSNTVYINKKFPIVNKKPIADRTASKYIAIFKQFLKWSGNKEVDFTVKYKSYPKPVINKTEFDQLRKTKIDDPYLDNIRNLFIIEVYTALRFSDFRKLFDTTIVDFKTKRIQVPIQKTGSYLSIPFLGDVGKYLKKLHDDEITIIPERSYNKNLKTMFEKIGFDKPCHIIKQLNNENVVEVKPFYEVVSSHTARRSFVTISYQLGMNPEEIRIIGGWSNQDGIKPYLNIAEEDAFAKAKSVWG